ncbi:MAG TPA: ABC transporter permease [Pirellulales bacterium]|nr:ABC transporter permease [Pirellulales bacterium]
MLSIAIQMLWHKPTRFIATVLGMATLFFVSIAQVGLLVGWVNTISAIIVHAQVDVWVMAQQTPAFDYGTAIPRRRIYQVRSVKGVAWAESMVMAWSDWQRPDGRRTNVEVVGIDYSSVGAPWAMAIGRAAELQRRDSVIVDEVFAPALGVSRVGDEVELLGGRATVRGLSRGVRTFTAAPFVFTSVRSALHYDKRYHDDEITYVIARCRPGVRPEDLAEAIRREVPNIEALTSDEFAWRSVTYWLLETGMGITVILTALLGMLVSSLVGSQTLYGVTNDHLSNYATLLAVGFSRAQLLTCVVVQAALLSALAAALGSAAFVAASRITERTPIPLEMVWQMYLVVLGLSFLTSLFGALLSLKTVWSIDPVTVFR